MRILFIDIDSMRPDHMGCYGYHRDTTPNIDRLATQSTIFTNVYASDTPCLPSRTALWTGRHGIHTGVIDHLGSAADPIPDGPQRGWHNTIGETNWMTVLRRLGYKTVTVSPFADRHSAWSWYAGYSEIHNIGDTYHGGKNTAPQVADIALDLIERNGKDDDWFLHLNFWDVHWPYRVPPEYGEPFEHDPLPEWLTENIRQNHWDSYGPKSAQDLGYRIRQEWERDYPRQPVEIANMQDVRKMFDGYDTAIHYVDHHIGFILQALEAQNILDETVIVIAADHGESLGELNMYMSHRIADHPVSHIPLIVRWPGITDQARRDDGLHYHFDWAATMIELLCGEVPKNWDAQSFTQNFENGEVAGRDCLVISAGVGGLTRSVRFGPYLLLRVYHDGYNGLDELMLFDLENDPPEQHNLAADRPDLVAKGLSLIETWHNEMMKTSSHPFDPLWQVYHEGGPQDMRGQLPLYLDQLRQTGREHWAEKLEEQYPNEC